MAGQVLVVEFVRRFAPAGAQAYIQSPSGTSGDSEQDGFVPSLDREDGVGNVHTRDAVAGTSDDDRTVDLRQTAVLQVLVAVPAYLSELYEVAMQMPMSVDHQQRKRHRTTGCQGCSPVSAGHSGFSTAGLQVCSLFGFASLACPYPHRVC